MTRLPVISSAIYHSVCIYCSFQCYLMSCLHKAPSVPLNLTFPPGGVLNDSITLTWLPPQHPNGVVRFYVLRWSSFGVNFFVNTTGNTTTAVLSDLTPGTQYTFSVRAFTVAFGPFSDQLSLHTADGEDTFNTICDMRVKIGEANDNLTLHV